MAVQFVTIPSSTGVSCDEDVFYVFFNEDPVDKTSWEEDEEDKVQIPDCPHLIVLPNSLMEQWIWEIKVFFNKKSMEIYQLPGMEKEIEHFFVNAKSPCVSSHTPMPLHIYLIVQSVS